jgi:hypothetical protein
MNLARGPSVDDAIKVRSEAEDVLARELEERHRGINGAADKGLRHLFKCQADELAVIEAHFAKGIERLDTQYQQFDAQRQQVLMASISEKLRKLALHAQPRLSRKDAFEELAAALRDFVRDKIVAEDRAFIYRPPDLN